MQKPFWQSSSFIALIIFIFSPVGLFLMWKYADWKKSLKVVLTIFIVIAWLPFLLFLFVWGSLSGLLFGIQTYDTITDFIHPVTPNESIIYSCQPINDTYGKCTNSKRGFSIEYPLSWGYIDLKPDSIGFSPDKANINDDNWVISMGPDDWDDETGARDFATKSLFGERPQITVDGLVGSTDETLYEEDNHISLFAALANGTVTYTFRGYTDDSITNEELRNVFNHIVMSLKTVK